MYVLVGHADMKEMRANDLPEYIVQAFSQGFPPNWEELVKEFMDFSTGARSTRARILAKSNDFVRPQPYSLPHTDSSEAHYQGSVDSRFGAIAEDDEVPDMEPPTSSGLSSSFGNLVFARESNALDAQSVWQRDQPSGSGYRSGASLFSSNRFAKPGAPLTVESSMVSAPVNSRVNYQNGYSDDIFSPAVQDESVYDNEEAYASEGKVRSDAEVDASSVQTPTTTDASPVLGQMASSPLTDAATMMLTRQAPRHDTRGKVDRATRQESSAPDSTCSSDSESAHTAEGLPGTAQNSPRLSGEKRRHRVVESSDESVATEDGKASPAKYSVMARRKGNRLSAGPTIEKGSRPPAASGAARRKSLNTPTKPALEPEPKVVSATTVSQSSKGLTTPRKLSSAKSRRSLADVVSAKAAKPVVAALPEAPAEDTVDEVSGIASSMDSVVTPKHKPRAGKCDGSSVKRNGTPRSAAKGKRLAATASEDEAENEKDSTDADEKVNISPTTPQKWKTTRNYFKSDVTKKSPTVTRSGRVSSQPGEYWANAQPSLKRTPKKSDLKFRWGTGEAVIVKGDKRIKLSELIREGGAGDWQLNDLGDVKDEDEEDGDSDVSARDE
ncbi:hypothetical protein GGI02_004608 [Coemansia sp. RSA 2322]|nr:hypothetical protein GGI02_004608 [Coemansia sp. RSA 2322]